MAIFRPLERLEKKYEIFPNDYKYSGNSSKLYEVENNVLAKIPLNRITKNPTNAKDYQKELFAEYNIHKLMVDLGLKFPKVMGQYSIKNLENGLYLPSFCIEEIGGKERRELSLSVQKEMDRLFNQEMEKANDLGIKIGDRHDMNMLWVPEKEDICMLDAGATQIKTRLF